MANSSVYPVFSHETGLIELAGMVNSDGTPNSGCYGVTVSKTGTGVYTLAINDQLIVKNTYLDGSIPSNLSMSANAAGTPVTCTFVCYVDVISPVPLSSSSVFPFATPNKGAADSSGNCVFTVKTGTVVAGGGANAVAADCAFSFKIVVSSIPGMKG